MEVKVKYMKTAGELAPGIEFMEKKLRLHTVTEKLPLESAKEEFLHDSMDELQCSTSKIEIRKRPTSGIMMYANKDAKKEQEDEEIHETDYAEPRIPKFADKESRQLSQIEPFI
ncbi:hypothetical protein CK203_023612 [Vitis vinifera]|uniref:Uncharacterized protein n=1 Tax=Vitis vinifera TaxID=29760 RepID=A0A438JC60_VITVI|nr:hypothetical protein CK203_087102 [Vitis vinifera]RVX06533.1 hypothetical protein CK203_023612 [Vitis vinifera]